MLINEQLKRVVDRLNRSDFKINKLAVKKNCIKIHVTSYEYQKPEMQGIATVVFEGLHADMFKTKRCRYFSDRIELVFEILREDAYKKGRARDFD